MFQAFSHHQVLTRSTFTSCSLAVFFSHWPMSLSGNNFVVVSQCTVLCGPFVKIYIIKNIKMLMLGCQICVSYLYLYVVYGCRIMWVAFCVLLLLVVLGPGPFLPLCNLMLVFLLVSSVVCFSMIFGYVILLCSLLYCVTARFSRY
jgi:hypothetical protein